LAKGPARGAQERGISASTAGQLARLTRTAISASRPRPQSNTTLPRDTETFVGARQPMAGFVLAAARSSALMSLPSARGVLAKGARGWPGLRRSGAVCVCGVICRVWSFRRPGRRGLSERSEAIVVLLLHRLATSLWTKRHVGSRWLYRLSSAYSYSESIQYIQGMLFSPM
jgi:hypothetical protein